VLVRFLRDNMSVFTWKPADMPGVLRNLIEHSLNVSKTARPIKQKLRQFARDKKEAVRTEITWLLAAGFIKEVYHPDWLANPVLVRKKNKEWRMCVDYTDLNKHCPKDPFGLPRIDEVVDSTAGCELLSFLDCYSGYHQISLKEDIRSKRLSLLLSAHTATRPCPLDSKTPEPPINGPSSNASTMRFVMTSSRLI